MPQLNVGQTGTLKSVPKLTKISADDNTRMIFKNMGNNHAYPFMWGSTHVISGGADTVVASGIKFHGLELAKNCNVVLTVTSGTQDGYVYIEKDAAANVVTVKSTGSNSIEVDIRWMLASADPEITGLYCSGMGNPFPSQWQ